jgi:nitrate/TMAO reductase-like tetraheme cytochrome c subunit
VATDPDRTTRPKRRLRLLIIGAAVVVVLGAVSVPVIAYTEQPPFCLTCHEMAPYYEAWQTGRHPKTSCMDCHVDPGLVARGAHKFVALKEVWDHFTTKPTFPRGDVTVPDARCVACHPSVPDKPEIAAKSKFSHAFHRKQASCFECHRTSGHEVTYESLAAAGVLASDPTTPPTPTGVVGTVMAGHVAVPCTRCHDMAKIGCQTCHTKKHADQGPCLDCHKPGSRWVFAHPQNRADCTACHKPPANHYGADCARCHKVGTPFNKATFTHPRVTHGYRSAPCAKCHPRGYSTWSCTGCHGPNPD